MNCNKPTISHISTGFKSESNTMFTALAPNCRPIHVILEATLNSRQEYGIADFELEMKHLDIVPNEKICIITFRLGTMNKICHSN